MKAVAEQMLSATSTPLDKRQEYWQKFTIYRATLIPVQ